MLSSGRLKIKLSGTNEILPINNQHLVNSFFHKLLGKENKYHNGQSNYVLSNLRGGEFIGEDKISFKNGGYVMISAHDINILNLVLLGLMKQINFYKDIRVIGFEYLPNEKFYDGINYFKTLSPILLKDKKRNFITINDSDFAEKLTEQTKRKLTAINSDLNLSDFNIIVNNHPAHKVKTYFIKKVPNVCSQCQIDIKCNKEVADILYNVGVGNSTGSGFGMIYKTESSHLY